jgi:hypothetical protein
MKIAKICPFRVYQNVQGPCESECQLFIPSKKPEGQCALSFLPALNGSLTMLNQTIVTVSRAMTPIR